MFKIDNDVDSVDNDADGDDYGDTDGFLGHCLNMIVEGLDPATVATMLELNITRPTAGADQKIIFATKVIITNIKAAIRASQLLPKRTIVATKAIITNTRISTSFTITTTNNTNNIINLDNKSKCH